MSSTVLCRTAGWLRPPDIGGATPSSTVAKVDMARVVHFANSTEQPRREPPLLVVPSLITRPTILDLLPGHSLIERLVNSGMDVYLVDWGAPRSEDADLGLEQYSQELLPRVIEQVQRKSKREGLSLLGYSLGATLALLHVAADPQGPVRNLVCVAGPVDFQRMGLFTVAGMMGSNAVPTTNVPAATMREVMNSIPPGLRLWRDLRILMAAWDPERMRLMRGVRAWAEDHVPLAAGVVRDLTTLVQENSLARGEFCFDDHPCRLDAVTVPCLSVVASYDHLVPYGSTEPLMAELGSADKEELVVPAGHVSMMVGRAARKLTWPTIESWLVERSPARPDGD